MHHDCHRYSFGCLVGCLFNRSVLPYPSLHERVVMVKVRKAVLLLFVVVVVVFVLPV